MKVAFSDFSDMLLSVPHEETVSNIIFDGIPFVFENNPEKYNILKDELHYTFGTPKDDILIVGSGSTGFSTAPYKYGNLFSPSSDIDVVIIDDIMFDHVWYTILDWHYPRRLSGLPQEEVDWFNKRHKELFWGWMHPEKIRYSGLYMPHMLDRINKFSNSWFGAFKQLSRRAELSPWQIKGRLYRTKKHAVKYHADGLLQIASTLTSS